MNPLSLGGTTMVPSSPLRQPCVHSSVGCAWERPGRIPRRRCRWLFLVGSTAPRLPHSLPVICSAIIARRSRLRSTATSGTVSSAPPFSPSAGLNQLVSPLVRFSPGRWRPGTSCILVRYRRWGESSATEPETRSFRILTAACGRRGLSLVDHLVVTEGTFSSAESQ